MWSSTSDGVSDGSPPQKTEFVHLIAWFMRDCEMKIWFQDPWDTYSAQKWDKYAELYLLCCAAL